MSKDIICGQNAQSGTREAIMQKSLELINDSGMIDFRIDALASALSLSPGNITYHFSRKEDICSALWDDFLAEFSQSRTSLTTLLDIKQLYLLARMCVSIAYKYRGMLIFRSADFGVISRSLESNDMNQQHHKVNCHNMYKLLVSNGYMLPQANDEQFYAPVVENSYLAFRWSINMMYQLYEESEIESRIDEASLTVTYALYPLLTEKGRQEFKYIAELVKNKQLVPKQ